MLCISQQSDSPLFTVKPDKRSFRKSHVVASNPSWLPLIGRYIVGAEEHNTWGKVRSLRNQALLYSQPFHAVKQSRLMLEIHKAEAQEILATIHENPHMEVQILILGIVLTQ